MEAICGERPLRIAALQYACREEDAAARLDRLEALARESQTDLLVTPELYVSGYDIGGLIPERAEPVDGPSARRLAEIARTTGTAIVCGYPERDGAALYNAAVAIGPDGARLANHRKLRQPFQFEKEHFSTGSAITSFELHGWRIGLAICYDIEFPEVARKAALAGAGLIVAPTATGDAWGFVARKMIPTRAFENGVYLAYANYAGAEGETRYLGESRICGPDGADLAEAGAEEAVLRATIEPGPIAAARARLPYLRDVATLKLD